MATSTSAFDKIIKQFASLRDGYVTDYLGVYSGSNEYMVGDIVSFGNEYLSLTGDCSSPNTQPLSDNSSWKTISESGPPLNRNENHVTLDYDSMSGNTDTVTQIGLGQYQFIVPNEVEILSFYMIAGGGSGGGGGLDPSGTTGFTGDANGGLDPGGVLNNGSGGGGSGNILTFLLSVTTGQILDLEVGQGGQGVSGSRVFGNPGGRTRVLLNGNVIATTLGGAGGYPGTGNEPSGGDGFYGGGAGRNSFLLAPIIGSGGTGVMENGNNAIPGGSGAGGGEGGTPGPFGFGGGGGGPGGGNSQGIRIGRLPGAGGAGKSFFEGSGPPSAAGADGQIIITW